MALSDGFSLMSRGRREHPSVPQQTRKHWCNISYTAAALHENCSTGTTWSGQTSSQMKCNVFVTEVRPENGCPSNTRCQNKTGSLTFWSADQSDQVFKRVIQQEGAVLLYKELEQTRCTYSTL